MNTKQIKLDINKKLYETITAKQGDTKSRFILFNLYDGPIPFDLTGRTVRVYGEKKDNTTIFNDLVINDAKKGYCTLELTNQMLAVEGMNELELVIFEGEKRLSTMPFILNVVSSKYSEDAIVSTNEFTALLNGLASLSEYDNYKNELNDARDGEVNVGTNIRKVKSQLETVVDETNEKIIHVNQYLLKDKFLATQSDAQAGFDAYLKWCLDYGMKEVYVPIGVWYVDGLEIKTNGIIFKGQGQNSIIKLKPNSNKNLITIKRDVKSVEFHDITLDGNSKKQTDRSTVLYCEGNNSYLYLNNVKIYNAYTDGIANSGVGHNYHNVEIYNCGRFGINFWAGDSFLNMVQILYCGQNGIVWRIGANKIFNSKIYLCGKNNTSCGAMEVMDGLYNFMFIGVELQENWCNGLLLNNNKMIRFEGIVDSNGITTDIQEEQRNELIPQRYGIVMNNVQHSSFNILSNDFRQEKIGGQHNQKAPVKARNSKNVDMIINNINNETNADIDVGVNVLN